MDNSLYHVIRQTVEQWLLDNKVNFDNKNITVDEVNNTEECLYLILKIGLCMASIVVSMPDFAPYRAVAFELGDIVDGIPKIVYAWYDNDTTTTQDIVYNLDKSVEIAFKYGDCSEHNFRRK